MSLTARQARFVELYLETGNGTDAATKAGYEVGSAHVTASRLLRNAKVSEAIEAGRRVLSDVFKIRREDVVAGLLMAIERAKVQGNSAAEITGWREVAKMFGFYAPEVLKVHLGDDQQRLQKKFEALSDAELLAVMQGGVHHEPAIQHAKPFMT